MTGTPSGDAGAEPASIRRRTVLASAAATAAVGPLVTAPSARADAPPGGTGAARPAAGSVARLLASGEADRDLDWIRAALQVAVELELSTLPPYLCAWWSVKDRGGRAARLIRRVIDDEMYHLGVVCNLLVAVGGQPRIKDAAPLYPGPLPGGVRPGLTVYLSGLTKPFVHDVMMAIEEPEAPLARSADATPTIGAFYGSLLQAFTAAAPSFAPDGQLSQRIGTDDLEPVGSLADVERLIGIVKEQGEGTGSSPNDALQNDEPAHYYAFGEIYHERCLAEADNCWTFAGDPVPFPDVRPMVRVPDGGWADASADVTQVLDRFDATYHDVLASLEAAWAGGGSRSLDAGVHAMRGLEATAVQLMETPLPDGTGTYGPRFRPPAPSPSSGG